MQLKDTKEAALKQAVLHIFGKRYKKTQQAISALAEDVWREKYGLHAKALKTIPKELLNTETSIRWKNNKGFEFEADFSGSLTRRHGLEKFDFQNFLERGGTKIWPDRIYKPCPQYSKPIGILPAEYGNRYRKIHADIAAIESEVKAFVAEMRANMRLVKNLNQLKKAWPGVEKFLPDGWDAALPPMKIEAGYLAGIVANAG